MADSEVFVQIDKGLNLYYRALGHYDYINAEGIGKFIEFCEENGLDGEEVEDDMDQDPESCQYCDFDEDFPFTEGERLLSSEAKIQIIYDVIASCWKTGLPPDKYRPRQPMKTRPVTTDIVVDAFLRRCSAGCLDVDGKPVSIDNIDRKVREQTTSFYLTRYNLKAPFDLDLATDDVLEAAETLFSNLFMYHSQLQETEDYEPLAIGYKNEFFPFLFFVLETFDRDRLRRAVEDRKEFELADWLKECDFVQEHIVEELGRTKLRDALEKAIIFYVRKWKNKMRVLPSKMEMERIYIIDDIYEVTDVVLALYRFVHELQETMAADTMFSCEFCIGIRSTRQVELTHAVSAGLGDDDDAEEEAFVHRDLIGDFQLNMRSNGIPHQHTRIEERAKYCEYLHSAWRQFKAIVEAKEYEQRPSTFGRLPTAEEQRAFHSPFPRNRRFCAFIDRRQFYNKTSFKRVMRPMMGGMGRKRMYAMQRGGQIDEEMMAEMGGMGGLFGMLGMYEWQRTDVPQFRDPDVDEVTFFIPDDQYLPTGHRVEEEPKNRTFIESYLEIMHTSMAPELRVLDDEKEGEHQATDRINGISSLNGSTFNVQFQVERAGEVRMYIHWNNQCIRLHAEDFWEVLPRAFCMEWKNNAKFQSDEAMHRKIRETFKFPDKYFKYFHDHLSVYHQPKHDWIDKPTTTKYYK